MQNPLPTTIQLIQLIFFRFYKYRINKKMYKMYKGNRCKGCMASNLKLYKRIFAHFCNYSEAYILILN